MYDTKFICAIFNHYLYCYYKEMIMMNDFIHALNHFHTYMLPRMTGSVQQPVFTGRTNNDMMVTDIIN
jgi:hypothetical protein